MNEQQIYSQIVTECCSAWQRRVRRRILWRIRVFPAEAMARRGNDGEGGAGTSIYVATEV